MNSTIRDYADAYTVLAAELRRSLETADDETKQNIEDELDTLFSKLKAAWYRGIEQEASPPALVPFRALPDPPATEDREYDDFARLFQGNGVPVPDGMRRWFADIPGGFDRSTPAERVQVYNNAVNYYDHQAEVRADKDDPTRCYACGRPGVMSKRRDGGAFFKCSDQNCGFQGSTGFVNSTWDLSNWSQKKARFRSGGGARGR